MGNPFDIQDYVDLTQIEDPRMKAEITRTLEYFATDKDGRNLLQKAASVQKPEGKVFFIVENGATSGAEIKEGVKLVTIDPEQIAHAAFFYTQRQQPQLPDPRNFVQCALA